MSTTPTGVPPDDAAADLDGPVPAPSPELRRRAVAGVRWGLVDQAVQQAVRFGVVLVLTNLVPPREFGVIAMAVVFVQLASLVGDLGLGPALVQRQQITRAHVDSAFVTTILLGVVLAAALALASPAIAAFFSEPDLQPVVAVMGLSFVFKGLQGVPRDLLRRDLRFRPFVITSGASVLIAGVAAVVLALRGADVWALVTYQLGEAVLGALFSLIAAARLGVWRPGFRVHLASLRELAGFGAFVSGSRFVYYAIANLDNLLVGRFLGSTALGLYGLAYRLMLYPIQKVADVIAQVTFPVLSTLQHDVPRLREAFLEATTRIAMICFPASVGTTVIAPALIPLAFGDRWLPAVTTVQILALNGPRIALSRLHGSVLQARGRPHQELGIAVVALAFTGVGFAIGVLYGIQEVALGLTVGGYLVYPVGLQAVTRSVRLSKVAFARRLAPIVVATAAMAIAGSAVMGLLDGDSSLVRVVAVVATSVVTYAVALRGLAPGLLSGVAREVFHR